MEHFVEGKPNRGSIAGALYLRFGEAFGEMNIGTKGDVSATFSISSIRERGF